MPTARILRGSAFVTLLVLAITKCLTITGIPTAYLFWGLVFVLGFLGPNGLSSVLDRLLFTWPVSLYAVFHVTVLVCMAAAHQPNRWNGWLARLAILGFLLLCYGYFELCKTVGMFVCWAFLFGLPCAFPLTCLAVRSKINQQGVWVQAVWSLLAFALFFWSGEGLLLWKSGQRPW